LKAREGDTRSALTCLYDHPNIQVRLNAAYATLAVAPQPARQVMEAIAAMKWHVQALDTGMTLRWLDDGRYKPT